MPAWTHRPVSRQNEPQAQTPWRIHTTGKHREFGSQAPTLISINDRRDEHIERLVQGPPVGEVQPESRVDPEAPCTFLIKPPGLHSPSPLRLKKGGGGAGLGLGWGSAGTALV